MRVFALGGYGTYGMVAMRLLAESDLVTEIALAGRTLKRGEQAAAQLGEKATAVQVDGTDEKQLASLLAGYDIIVNTTLSRVEGGVVVLPALRAAIRAGAHYCDVAHGPVMDQALELSAEARAAGITAIVGMGIQPGLTNLMAARAAHELDEVEQLQLGWPLIWLGTATRLLTPQQWLEDPQQSLATIQEFRPFIAGMLRRRQETASRTIRTYQDSQWVDVDPVRTGVEVPLPQGGTVTAYPYGSSDLFISGALPLNVSKVPPVQVWFSPFPPQLHDLFREQALRVTGGEVDAATAVNSFFKTIKSDPDRWLTVAGDFVAPPVLWVNATGSRGGRAARQICWLSPISWIERNNLPQTSGPLAVAALRILGGEMRERGVFWPDTAFEPLAFFDEVARLLPEPPPDGKLVGESFKWLE